MSTKKYFGNLEEAGSLIKNLISDLVSLIFLMLIQLILIYIAKNFVNTKFLSSYLIISLMTLLVLGIWFINFTIKKQKLEDETFEIIIKNNKSFSSKRDKRILSKHRYDKDIDEVVTQIRYLDNTINSRRDRLEKYSSPKELEELSNRMNNLAKELRRDDE